MLLHILLVASCIASSCAIWPQPLNQSKGTDVRWLDPAVKTTLHCNGAIALLYSHDSSEYQFTGLIHELSKISQVFFGHFQIFTGNKSRHETPNSLSESFLLQAAARETIAQIHRSGFVPWKMHKRHSAFEPDAHAPRQYVSAVQIHQMKCPDSHDFAPVSFFDGDESYELTITNETATIKSNHTIGSLRALQTLQQAFFAHSTLSGSYMPDLPLHIVDRPRWRHRGLSIDIARNPFRPEDLIRTLDAMAMTKLNRLHIHATDSQSWPLDIPSLPKLASKGAYQPNLIWTVNDLSEIQAHGVMKGISVFVEIDMPGHTASIAHSYPDLIAAFNELDWSTFAAEPLSGQLKLNSSAVNEFVSTVLLDLLPRTRPYTSLYHIGGDEVNLQAYLLDETVSSDDPHVLQPLLQKFVDRLINITIQQGLRPIIWEEMLLDWNLTLSSAVDKENTPSTLVQVWRDSQRIEEVLKRGHRVIFGDYKHWYLDCGYGIFLDPYPMGKSPHGVPFNTSGGIPSKLHVPYLDYCAPFHNWRHMYMYDPVANISSDLVDGVEGGEVLLWSEQTDSMDLDSKLWPRVAAAAEVLWAGVRNDTMLEDAARRLGEWRERAVTDLGVRMSPVQMTWCLQERGCNL
ncbi:beta-N-acetylhexosaminidase [Exophiala viscosa]|uniref:Beta-hexosaminidase n=1 Tax=Exophiala viscosa TaxID=2486360 RepID=A0AAN6DL01_9EURO|nr:beta-N-acetylhexosaminidase [Exophiala viscosa]KAI1628427.1 beta-N-acetylhexosaminidase [Exophiala viscosa]